MTGQFDATRPVSRHPSSCIIYRYLGGQQHRGMGDVWTQLEPRFRLRRTFDPGFIHGPT
jgi:hypothetical protein